MIRARAGILALVALTTAFILSPASAKPPGRNPCTRIERRAKAQLKRGLRACPRRNAAACGASQWSRYRTSIARKGCTSPDQIAPGQLEPIIRRPSIIAVRSSGGSAGDLAARDAAAIAAYPKLRPVAVKIRAAVSALPPGANYLTATAAIAPFVPMMKDAFTDVLTKEAALGATEAKIWSRFATDWSLPSVIGEPLAAAMEELQIETRRLLGPAFSTDLEELAGTRGCQGDLIRDRLLARYGEAVANPAADEAAAVDALGRFAAQLACLSAQQTDALDFALYRAHAKVSMRLQKHGLGPVRPAFTRLVAPLALLVLDTVKHEGERALAWRWFVEQHDTLADAVARLGWPTDDVVWLYDRVEGRLVGFCTLGATDGCLDLRALLDSLVDPNALGIGDCALSGMVAGGLRGPAGNSRYACPSVCSTAPASLGGIGSVGKGALTRPSGPPPSGSSSLPWSNVTSSDLSTMRGYCGAGGGGAGGGGGGGGSAGGQGPGLDGAGNMQQCVRDVLSGPRDPYGRFVQCVAEVTGANDRLHSALAPLDLHGVPMDARCGLMDEASPSSGSGTTPTTTPPTTTPTSTTPPTTVPPATDDDHCEICTAIGDAIIGAVDAVVKTAEKGSKEATEAVKNFFDSLSPTDPLPALSPEKPTGPSGVGAVVAYEWQLIKAAPVANEAVRSVLDDRIAQYCASGDLSAGECKVMENLPPDEKRNYLNNKGLKDCADPAECDSGCTSLNEQVMERMQACQQQLEDELTPDQGGPLDPVINPAPDAPDGHGPDDPLAACLVGADGAHGVDMTCGVVTCADGPASMRTLNQCCQAIGTGVGLSLDQILTATLCERAQCADGETTAVGGAGACGCGGPGAPAGGAPTPAPRPGPAR